MALKKKRIDPERRAQFLAQIQREQAQRQVSYRDRALALFPHVCARCGREFSGKELSGLTVHHKDNNHSNNPPDGSNWELLCLYCHDYEHQELDGARLGGASSDRHVESSLDFRPFAGLENLLKPDSDESKPEGD